MKNYGAISLTLLFLTSSSVFAKTTTVSILGTQKDSKVSGKVTLTEFSKGLAVQAEVENLSPGKHGFHFHENGSCAENGKAAGGHFNPDGKPHGSLMKDGLAHAHAGDLGNIEVGADGKGKLQVILSSLSLRDGKYSVAGRSVIIHEKADDLTGQPAGNAGERIGCGVIEKTE